MFALNEESLANHIGERKIRMEQDDIERLEKEKQLELEAASASAKEIDPEEEISVVHVGQVAKRKFNADGSNFETVSQASRQLGQSQFGQSMSGFSQMQSIMGQSTASGVKVQFLNSAAQNR